MTKKHNKRALTRQTSPIDTPKEPERQNTRTLYIRQHSPTHTKKKPTYSYTTKKPYTRAYSYDKRALHTRQKSPADMTNEPQWPGRGMYSYTTKMLRLRWYTVRPESFVGVAVGVVEIYVSDICWCCSGCGRHVFFRYMWVLQWML